MLRRMLLRGRMMILCPLLILAVLVVSVWSQHTAYKVTCTYASIPNLDDVLPMYRSARICYPAVNSTFPLHVFAHGDVGGGLFFHFYHALQEEIASLGFVVPAYLACWFDAECSNGEASFLQVLKTIDFLEQRPRLTPVDWSKPYSASGHSTGARVVLMLAAVRDNRDYLAETAFASQITPSMRTSLSKLKAVIADHPDPMYDSSQDPDIKKFDISRTPVFVITGSADLTIEPEKSAWKDFQMISTRDKVFVNMRGSDHNEPLFGHLEGPFIADFAKLFALGDMEAGARIYGDGVGSLQRTLQLAQPGDANSGDGKVAFLACLENGTVVPSMYKKYCESSSSLDSTMLVL